MKKWFWIILVFVVAGSCLDEPDCVNLNNAYVGIAFKKIFDGKADTVIFTGILSSESDSIFYPYTRATAIQLPLNQFATQTQFQLKGIYGENFLVMDYENKPVQFVSEDCGARYVLSNLAFTDHDFDSLKIITNILSGTDQVNIEVYRCPRTNQVKLAFRQLVDAVEKADTVYLNTIAADFSTVFFIPNDTLSYINLPLNPNSASTTFYFDFKDGSNQAITFNYTRTAWSELEAVCGTQTVFSDLSSNVYDFSDVRISKDSVQDPPITNVAIFK